MEPSIHIYIYATGSKRIKMAAKRKGFNKQRLISATMVSGLQRSFILHAALYFSPSLQFGRKFATFWRSFSHGFIRQDRAMADMNRYIFAYNLGRGAVPHVLLYPNYLFTLQLVMYHHTVIPHVHIYVHTYQCCIQYVLLLCTVSWEVFMVQNYIHLNH